MRMRVLVSVSSCGSKRQLDRSYEPAGGNILLTREQVKGNEPGTAVYENVASLTAAFQYGPSGFLPEGPCEYHIIRAACCANCTSQKGRIVPIAREPRTARVRATFVGQAVGAIASSVASSTATAALRGVAGTSFGVAGTALTATAAPPLRARSFPETRRPEAGSGPETRAGVAGTASSRSMNIVAIGRR